jgi:hypothetical protein
MALVLHLGGIGECGRLIWEWSVHSQESEDLHPPHSYGGGHRAVVGGQAGTPPVASRVCRTSFHDPHVAEGLRKKHRHTFHCAGGRPVLGSLTV